MNRDLVFYEFFKTISVIDSCQLCAGYDEIFNLINMKYSIDDEKTLSISLEVSFINQSQSQSLKWSDDPANGGSDTWGIDGDTLYIAGTKLTRINN